MSFAAISQNPRWYYIPLRVLVLTFFATLLCFAVGLFVGICVVLLTSVFHGTSPDLRMAYRHIALPAGVAACAIILITSTIVELRRYRRAKTLIHIERQIERAG
ncbi:MAG TPA: hypothetical protein VH596_12720 [Terriglobales bacterium]|jgi:TRAP-type C4-dicarboxylate transport system permease small subunit